MTSLILNFTAGALTNLPLDEEGIIITGLTQSLFQVIRRNLIVKLTIFVSSQC